MNIRLKLLVAIFLSLLIVGSRSSRAFHIVIPGTLHGHPPTADWNCFQQPIELGVNGTNTAQVSAAHLGWMRMTIYWADVEPSQGVWAFGGDDAVIDAAAASGIKVLAILSTAPAWANGGATINTPAPNIALWQTFVQTVAQRYNGKVAAYEIWNEPNISGSSTKGVGWDRSLTSPPLWVDYLHAASVLIHQYAPGTLVVGPVLSSTPDSNGNLIFNQMETTTYSDGPGYSFLDVVSFHANGNIFEGGNGSSADVANQLITGHLNQIDGFNRGKPIWLTEFGWNSSQAGLSGQETKIFNIVEYVDGDITHGGFDCEDFAWYKFTNVFIYNLQDSSGSTQGIYDGSGNPKPTVTQFTELLPFPAKQPADGYQPMTSSCTGRTCTFTNPYTTNQSTTRYSWDFGDGTISSVIGTRTASHTYSAAGSYFVATGASNDSVNNSFQSDIELIKLQ